MVFLLDAKKQRRCLQVLPVLVIFLCFAVFISFIVYSMEAAKPTPPQNRIDCAAFLNGSNRTAAIERYAEDRHVLDDAIERHMNASLRRAQQWNGQERNGSAHSTAWSPHSNSSADTPMMSCREIGRRRFLPPDVATPFLKKPHLLFVRLVSRDYMWVEETLTIAYAPTNFYCYPIADDATEEFVQSMTRLAACLFNVVIPHGRFSRKTVRGELDAQRACLLALDQLDWDYVLVNDEMDLPLRSWIELSEYADDLDGQSIIANQTLSAKMALVLRHSLNAAKSAEHDVLINALSLWWKHGKYPIVLARPMAALFYHLLLDLSTELPRVDAAGSLTTNEADCAVDVRDRRGNCVATMENLSTLSDMSNPAMFVRAEPSFDFGVVECMHEVIFNRTYGAKLNPT